MKDKRPASEPLCETSEKGEQLFTRQELVPVGLEIGRRILEIFGYQELSSIVFRLKSTADEINSVINGEEMPSVELLLSIHTVTGASIDWLVTGKGRKYVNEEAETEPERAFGGPRHIHAQRIVPLEHHAR